MKKIALKRYSKKKSSRRWPTAVDLYSGCGSVTAAMKKRHFRVVAAVDIDPVACATYRKNHPSTHLFEDDIRNVDPASIRYFLPSSYQLDLLVVCAPCQPFSYQNRHKGSKDDREKLILEAVRFAEVLHPRIIMFENVPGLVGANFKSILDELIHALTDIGYKCGKPTSIDAADYLAPQRRARCLLFAAKELEPPQPPMPISPEGKRVTVAAALKGLKSLCSGEKDDSDYLHFARKHKEIALKRLACIPKNGGSRFSLPPNLELDCHRGKKGYPDVYGRMRWEDVAPTLTTGCTDITRGRFAHPDDDRAITLREAARLQTFPDDYKFCGNASKIATQIGNAVPMKLIEAMVPAIRQVLASQ